MEYAQCADMHELTKRPPPPPPPPPPPVTPWYILLYNFLVTHPNLMEFGDMCYVGIMNICI